MSSVKGNVFKKVKKAIFTEIIEKEPGLLNPVIVNFQNGELNPEHAKDLKVTFNSTVSGKTNVEVKSPYGQVFKEANVSDPVLKQFIAIRNKKTKKVRLIEVDNAFLINSDLIIEKKIESADSLDYSKDLTILNKTFGGKKLVNRLHQKEKLNFNSISLNDDIKNVVGDIKSEKDEMVSNNLLESESIIKLLPPCNRTASKLGEIYVLTDILSNEELDALKEEIANLNLEEKIGEKEYSTFFEFCYQEIKKDNENLQTRLAGILFAETLIKFLKTPTKQLTAKKAVFCTFSNAIHSMMLREFCIKTGSLVSRPFSMRDKIICYIIAVCLISCNYQINLKLLAVATSIHLNRLSRLAKVVGAVPGTKNENIFVLKLPLPPLPKSAASKARKK